MENYRITTSWWFFPWLHLINQSLEREGTESLYTESSLDIDASTALQKEAWIRLQRNLVLYVSDVSKEMGYTQMACQLPMQVKGMYAFPDISEYCPYEKNWGIEEKQVTRKQGEGRRCRRLYLWLSQTEARIHLWGKEASFYYKQFSSAWEGAKGS